MLRLPFVAALGGQACAHSDFADSPTFFWPRPEHRRRLSAGLLDPVYIAFLRRRCHWALLASPAFRAAICRSGAILPIGAALACALPGVARFASTLKPVRRLSSYRDAGLRRIVRIFMNNLNTPVNITKRAAGHYPDRPPENR